MTTRETCRHHVDFLNTSGCPDCAQEENVHARRAELIARLKAVLDPMDVNARAVGLVAADLRALLSLAETSSPFPATDPYRTSARPIGQEEPASVAVPAAKEEPAKRSINLSKDDLVAAVRAWAREQYGTALGRWEAHWKYDEMSPAYTVSWTNRAEPPITTENDQGM